MKEKNYIKLQIPISGFEKDTLSGLLFYWGCLGIEEQNDETWIIYFPGDYDTSRFESLLQRLKEMNTRFQPEQVSIQSLPQQNWNTEWKKYFKPLAITPHIWIRPPWEQLPPDAGGMEIIIDPQMAFGTGHHETTQLMMQSLELYSPSGKKVLDVGTGSGILSIAAEKMEAREILAIDVDPAAIENARHNFELNRVRNIHLRMGDIDVITEKDFEIILANINLETILRLAFNFLTLLAPGGVLIISGFLKEDYPRISYVYKHTGLELVRQLEMGEWLALIWERLS